MMKQWNEMVSKRKIKVKISTQDLCWQNDSKFTLYQETEISFGTLLLS
jgi:hypothetical protein